MMLRFPPKKSLSILGKPETTVTRFLFSQRMNNKNHFSRLFLFFFPPKIYGRTREEIHLLNLLSLHLARTEWGADTIKFHVSLLAFKNRSSLWKSSLNEKNSLPCSLESRISRKIFTLQRTCFSQERGREISREEKWARSNLPTYVSCLKAATYHYQLSHYYYWDFRVESRKGEFFFHG